MLTQLSFLLSVAQSIAGGNALRIHNASELFNFSSKVKSGTTYKGSTVYLDSDIDFTSGLSQQFEPISQYFQGTFDGQGHIISNLVVNSPDRNVGLFGDSSGASVRNIVIDDSCSFTSTYNKSDIHIGGIFGTCMAQNEPCIIENAVNMANVTLRGNIYDHSRIGGFVGCFHLANYNATIRNSVNYGSLAYLGGGGVNFALYIGGIISHSENAYIYNCLNYGTITSNATYLNNTQLGGIVGIQGGTKTENCLSAGKIYAIYTTQTNLRIGGIAGNVEAKNDTMKYCFWTSDVGANVSYNVNVPENLTGTPNTTTDITKAVNELNNQASLNMDWGRWFINSNNSTITFKINDNKGFSVSSQVLLVSEVVENDDSTFGGWFTDPYLNSSLLGSEISGDITLYGLFGSKITVTFDANGGSVSSTSKNVTLNGTYGELPVPSREEYIFEGWANEANEMITNKSKVSNPENHTLYAQWSEIPNYVEIVFGTKDLSKDDIEKVIVKFATAEFTIVKIDHGDPNRIRVIVKFNDAKTAESFIQNIEESSDSSKAMIESVNFFTNRGSLSSVLRPMALLNFLYLLFINAYI